MTFVERMRLIVVGLGGLAATVVAAGAEDVNDYPTSARSEYVFGCMKANGETRQIDRSVFLLDRHHCVPIAVRPLRHRRNGAEHVAGSRQSRHAVPFIGTGEERPRRPPACPGRGRSDDASRTGELRGCDTRRGRFNCRNRRPSIPSERRGPTYPWPRRGSVLAPFET